MKKIYFLLTLISVLLFCHCATNRIKSAELKKSYKFQECFRQESLFDKIKVSHFVERKFNHKQEEGFFCKFKHKGIASNHMCHGLFYYAFTCFKK